jgi:hypothetical protein
VVQLARFNRARYPENSSPRFGSAIPLRLVRSRQARQARRRQNRFSGAFATVYSRDGAGARRRNMKNGLFSIQIQMLDGVRGRDSGVTILRDGQLISGGPYFWSIGTYTADNGTWKGQFSTSQHTPFSDPNVQPVFRAAVVTSGFSGTYTDEDAEVFGTTLVGSRSLSFHATLKRLVDL